MDRVTSLAAALCLCATVSAQEPAPAPVPPAEGEKWEFSFEAYSFTVPDDHSYVQPVFAADRDWLHLEARYNYEAIDTASVWAGWNFEFGDEVSFEVTQGAKGP